MDNRYVENVSSKTSENSFFKCTWTFSRVDHILGNKTILSKLKKTEIISSLFWPQWYDTRIQLQEENWNKNVEPKRVTKQPMGQQINQIVNKDTLKQMKMKTQLAKNLWNTSKAVLRGKEVYNDTGLLQENPK